MSNRLNKYWKAIFLVFTIAGIITVVNQLFMLRIFGLVLIQNRYLYLLFGLFIPFVFILKPATSRAHVDRVPWYDVILFTLSIIVFAYFVYVAPIALAEAWAYVGGWFPTVMSFLLWLLLLEAVRRSTPLPFTIVISFFTLYPLFAGYMPTIISGHTKGFVDLVRLYVMGDQSIVGEITNVFGSILIGFIVFGIVLNYTGGGDFFMGLALSLTGRSRGGPAKVSVLGSGLFGSLSGSAVSNVLTTGVITIPAMKAVGYPSRDAAAIECCASLGGVLMPPVMSAVAFIMAAFLRIPYIEVAKAAVIPSVLFYLSLMVQVDLFSLRTKQVTSWPHKIKPFKEVFAEGWFYLFAFIVLVYVLFYLRLENRAPWFAMAALLACSMLRAETRLTLKKLEQVMLKVGETLADMSTLFAGISLIVGSIFMTGVGTSFSREVVVFAGGNIFLLLMLGAVASFVLGMGMTLSGAYIFLAIALSPALEGLGLNPIAVHLFMLYWAMFSNITPPVALTAFAASTIAGESPLKIGYAAMRYGLIIYFLPFFFVLNPVMILQNVTVASFLIMLVTAVLGIVLLNGAIQGYIYVLGMKPEGGIGILIRLLVGVGGFMLVSPDIKITLVGIVISLVGLILWALMNKSRGSFDDRPGLVQ